VGGLNSDSRLLPRAYKASSRMADCKRERLRCHQDKKAREEPRWEKPYRFLGRVITRDTTGLLKIINVLRQINFEMNASGILSLSFTLRRNFKSRFNCRKIKSRGLKRCGMKTRHSTITVSLKGSPFELLQPVSRSAANRLETVREYKSPAHIIRFPREPQFVFPALSSFSVRRCPLAEPVLLPYD